MSCKEWELTRISDKIYAPIKWLDTLVPVELKLLPNPYHEYPYRYFDTQADVNGLYEYVKRYKDEADRIGVISTEEGIVQPKTKSGIRNTYNLLPDENFLEEYTELFLRHKEDMERFFNVSIVQSGDPQILIYTPGCFYIRHSDNCTELLSDGKLAGFKPVASHRVVTTVLFLSDCVEKVCDAQKEYSGGELRFDFLCDEHRRCVTVAPKKGFMISFLSNPYFSHSVLKVKEGLRISVAQWHRAIAH